MGSFELYEDLKLDQSMNRMLDTEHIRHTSFSRFTETALLATVTVGGIFVVSVIVYRRLTKEPTTGASSI
jgi:hypothetical protein